MNITLKTISSSCRRIENKTDQPGIKKHKHWVTSGDWKNV
jgi:hypothetical protein